MNMFAREVQIMKQLDHVRSHGATTRVRFDHVLTSASSSLQPNCVKLFKTFTDDFQIYIVMEFVDGGDLLDYIMNRGGLSTLKPGLIGMRPTSLTSLYPNYSRGRGARDCGHDVFGGGVPA